MTVKEIRQTGNFLYERSSQYIVNVFIIVGTITAFTQLFASSWYGLIASLLVAPLELGCIRALLKAYDRKGKEVTTKEYLMMGIKEYKQYAPIFIGKTLFIWLAQAVVIALAIFIFSSSSIKSIPTALLSAWSGNVSLLLGDLDVETAMAQLAAGTLESGITISVLMAVLLSNILAFIMRIYYVLTFYYAVDQGRDIGDSLRDSRYALTGNVMNYIKLALGFAIKYILSIFIIYAVNVSLNSLGQMLLDYVGKTFRIPVVILFELLMAFVTTLVAIVLYQVKYQMALTVFYKELEKDEEC